MSVVTNVILVYSIMEDQPDDSKLHPVLVELNKSLEPTGKDRLVHFHPFDFDGDRVSTGTKAMETNICLGGFNHLDLPNLIACVKAAPWKEPEHVQLFVMEDGDDIFTERLHRHACM